MVHDLEKLNNKGLLCVSHNMWFSPMIVCVLKAEWKHVLQLNVSCTQEVSESHSKLAQGVYIYIGTVMWIQACIHQINICINFVGCVRNLLHVHLPCLAQGLWKWMPCIWISGVSQWQFSSPPFILLYRPRLFICSALQSVSGVFRPRMVALSNHSLLGTLRKGARFLQLQAPAL